MDINFEDEIKALILISSLPESCDTIVAAFSSSHGSENLMFDEIYDVDLRKCIHKREVRDSSVSAFSVNRRGRSKTKGQNQHGRSKSKNRGKLLNRSNVTCWNCGKKRSLSDELYKAKEETESEIWR